MSLTPQLAPSVAVGIDVVEVGRVRKLVERWEIKFLKRCFTEQELATAGGSIQSLSARLAAKEACYKALEVGTTGLRWCDIEVVKGTQGRPGLLLHGRAAEAAVRSGWKSSSLSLTHTAEVAVAVVVALIYEGVSG